MLFFVPQTVRLTQPTTTHTKVEGQTDRDTGEQTDGSIWWCNRLIVSVHTDVLGLHYRNNTKCLPLCVQLDAFLMLRRQTFINDAQKLSYRNCILQFWNYFILEILLTNYWLTVALQNKSLASEKISDRVELVKSQLLCSHPALCCSYWWWWWWWIQWRHSLQPHVTCTAHSSRQWRHTANERQLLACRVPMVMCCRHLAVYQCQLQLLMQVLAWHTHGVKERKSTMEQRFKKNGEQRQPNFQGCLLISSWTESCSSVYVLQHIFLTKLSNEILKCHMIKIFSCIRAAGPPTSNVGNWPKEESKKKTREGRKPNWLNCSGQGWRKFTRAIDLS